MGTIVNVKAGPNTVKVTGAYPSSPIDESAIESAVANALSEFDVPVTVKDFGAIGDGVTDDTSAIESAIESIGPGGLVFFPTGSYRISRPLRPLRGQRLEGTYQVRYSAGLIDPTDLTRGSMIAALPTFVGQAMIIGDENLEPNGVHITRLAIVGPGESHESGCHGIFNEGGYGESSWWVEQCQINNMPGYGVTGHLWVFDMRDTHISRCSWGLKITGTDGMLDTRIIGSMFYFNRDGGVGLDGGWTGLIEFVACRVERSGNKYGYPFEPINTNAPGFSITSAHQCVFTNCSTDANTGAGLHMVRKGSGTYLYNMEFQGCHFLRDGGGEKTWENTEWWTWTGGLHQVTGPEQGTAPPSDVFPVTKTELAGIYIGAGVTQSSFVNCSVGRGPHTDWAIVPPWGGDPILDGFGPRYGLKAENTTNVTVSNCQFDSALGDLNAISADDSNWQLDIKSLHHRRMSLPVYWTESDMPLSDVATGRVAYLANKRSLAVAGYGGEWHLIPAPTADAPVKFQKQIDILTTETPDTAGLIRFLRDNKSLWHVGHNPSVYTKSFFIVRYDSDGNYVDDPFAIDYATGRVNLRHAYIESRTNATTLGIQGFLDQTSNLTEWRNRTTASGYSTVAGVRNDGRIFGQPATASNDFVTLSQLSGGATPTSLQISTTGSGGLLSYKVSDILSWTVGHNSDVAGRTFFIGRHGVSGEYLDDPISISKTTGRVNLRHTYIESLTGDAASLSIQGFQDQTTNLQEWRTKTTVTPPPTPTYSYSTVAGVRSDGRVFGTAGTASNDFVTVAQMASGAGTSNSLVLDGTGTQEKSVSFKTDGVTVWKLGQNSNTYGSAFYLYRADTLGDYSYTIIGVNATTGTIELTQNVQTSRNPATPATVSRGAVSQSANIQVWQSNDGTTISDVAGVRPDGRVFGASGSSSNDFVTKSQLDAAGGTTIGNAIDLNATAVQSARVDFNSDTSQTWEIGVNADANGNTLYFGRYVAGVYTDTPLLISKSTGSVEMKRMYVGGTDPAAVPVFVRGATSQTASLMRVEDSGYNAKFEVLYNGKVRLNWGNSAFATVQLGSVQIVREGVGAWNTLMAAYTSTANADADNSIFEVYGNGQMKVTAATDSACAMNLGQFKAVVAASSDFADFKSRVAAL